MTKITGSQYDEQASTPATPSTGHWKLYPKADGFYALDDAGAETGPLGAAGPGGTTPEVLHVQDQRASGTQGGAATSGAWETRTLNTLVTNEVTGASLAANTLTLPSGDYEAFWGAPALDCDQHQTRLYDVTGAAVILLGSVEFAYTSDLSATRSIGQGKFTLAVQSDIRLEHRVGVSKAVNGYGNAAGWGTEVYADLLLRKVA